MKPVLLMVVNDPIYFLSHRLPVAREAMGRGYDVHIASIDSVLSSSIEELGFKYHLLPLDRGGVNPAHELLSIVKFWKLLRVLRPAILHLVTTKPVLYGGLAARLAPVGGVVAAVAGLGSVFISKKPSYTILRMMLKFMYKLAFGKKNLKVIFQNPDDRAELIRLNAVPLHKTVLILGSGVDLQSYSVKPEPEGAIVVTFAARLIKDKGIREYVDAARYLRGRGVKAVFQVAGDVDPGNPTSLSSDDVNSLASEEGFRVLGHRDDMHKVLSDSHIIVLPSYREGLPKVLIEAAAVGRAIVTTDVPGCRDAILNGVTGLLVPPRDHFALADAVALLIEDSHRRNKFGSAGRLFAEETFDINKVVAAHMTIYEGLARSSNP